MQKIKGEDLAGLNIHQYKSTPKRDVDRLKSTNETIQNITNAHQSDIKICQVPANSGEDFVLMNKDVELKDMPTPVQ